MDDRSKSILLQVAFKEAATAEGTAQGIKDRTLDLYTVLIELHTSLGLDPQPARGGGGGGGGAPRPRMARPEHAVDFALNGTQWTDYRAAKTANEVKAGFPDFKTSDGKTSKWLYEKDGSQDPIVPELIAAATAASLAAPM